MVKGTVDSLALERRTCYDNGRKFFRMGMGFNNWIGEIFGKNTRYGSVS